MQATVLKPRPFRIGTPERRLFLATIVLFAALAFVVNRITTPYMATATVAYLMLLAGVLCRREKTLHIPLMAAGIATDISLVLVLELKRSAIATAFGGTLNPLQMGHIALSAGAVLLYFPTVYLGARAARGRAPRNRLHLYWGRVAFCFRTGGFILMFSLLEHVRR